jgi:hypothetical protein
MGKHRPREKFAVLVLVEPGTFDVEQAKPGEPGEREGNNSPGTLAGVHSGCRAIRERSGSKRCGRRPSMTFPSMYRFAFVPSAVVNPQAGLVLAIMNAPRSTGTEPHKTLFFVVENTILVPCDRNGAGKNCKRITE